MANRFIFRMMGAIVLLAFTATAWAEEPPARHGQEWQGFTGGPAGFAVAVARTPDDWRRLWADLGRAPPAALDSASQMAVAVFLGLRRTGGYGVEITSVGYEGTRLVVRYAERRPAPGAFVPQMLSTPYVVKVLARSDGEVVFREQ